MTGNISQSASSACSLNETCRRTECVSSLLNPRIPHSFKRSIERILLQGRLYQAPFSSLSFATTTLTTTSIARQELTNARYSHSRWCRPTRHHNYTMHAGMRVPYCVIGMPSAIPFKNHVRPVQWFRSRSDMPATIWQMYKRKNARTIITWIIFGIKYGWLFVYTLLYTARYARCAANLWHSWDGILDIVFITQPARCIDRYG